MYCSSQRGLQQRVTFIRLSSEKLKTTCFVLVVLILLGCKQKEPKNEQQSNSLTESSAVQKIPDHLDLWTKAINKQDDDALENSYAADAVKIISPDSILNGVPQIAQYYKNHQNKITFIQSLFSLEANTERAIHYDIITYKTVNTKEYVQLLIWSAKDEKKGRIFEFTQERHPTAITPDTTAIAKRRKLWIELCNAHNARNLVEQLYSPHTMYFNHKPIVKGREDLIKAYDYMNNTTYSLNLHPLKLEIINANYAFEIGQCSGSYRGKYILIWKKQANGTWSIYIDSNI
ncbi:Cif family virulence factor [Spongiimicrobium salis]|uniref:hypothetical protein n=1 Tax=Spongiimicrobium salis TaxID=1667022 RepID=UPI00374D0ECC